MATWKPPDLARVTVYTVGERTQNPTDVEILAQIGTQVISRAQFKWNESVTHLDASLRDLAPVIEACHQRDMVFGGGLTCSAIYEVSDDGEQLLSRDRLELLACRDARGRLARSGPGGAVYHGCLNNPAYVAYVDAYIRQIIDGGVDAIHFDEADTRWFFYQPGEGFCDHCEDGLRGFLAARYTPGQLRERFGVEDPSTFRYRAYLAERGLQDSPALSPLAADWWLFQLTSCREKWQRWLALARDYAQERRGIRLITTANVCEPWKMPERALESPDLDYVMLGTCLNEEYRQDGQPLRALRLLPDHSYIPLYRMATAQTPHVPVTLFIDWPPGAVYMNERPLRVQKDIIRWCFAEAYAAQAFFNAPFTSCYNLWTGPVDVLIRYGQFLRAHEHLFHGTRPVPQVGVLFSYASSIWDYFPLFLSPEQGGPIHQRQFEGVCQILLGANVQFQALFAGDGHILPDDLALDQLQRFPSVILPQCYALSDRQMGLLCAYMRAVGRWSPSVRSDRSTNSGSRAREDCSRPRETGRSCASTWISRAILARGIRRPPRRCAGSRRCRPCACPSPASWRSWPRATTGAGSTVTSSTATGIPSAALMRRRVWTSRLSCPANRRSASALPCGSRRMSPDPGASRLGGRVALSPAPSQGWKYGASSRSIYGRPNSAPATKAAPFERLRCDVRREGLSMRYHHGRTSSPAAGARGADRRRAGAAADRGVTVGATRRRACRPDANSVVTRAMS